MKKILLINPNRTHPHGSKKPQITLPLGLMYVAASAERGGHNVKILDCLLHKETVIYQADGYIFNGILEKTIINEILKFNPDIVGIGMPFSAQAKNAELLLKLVRKVLPECVIIVGGPHASVSYRNLLKNHNEIDFAVIGEGELALRMLADLMDNTGKVFDATNIANLSYRDKDGRVVDPKQKIYCQNMDTLPMPAYHLIDMDLYFKLTARSVGGRSSKYKRGVAMISSRGCPYNCVFCSIHIQMGKKWRAHSCDYVIEHIKFLKDKYNILHIYFEDDNFTFDIERTIKILESISEMGDISWSVPNGVRADKMNEKLAMLIKKSGCKRLVFGIESGDQYVLKNIIEKNLSLEQVTETLKICKKFKIKTEAFYVVGFPGEKINNIKKSLKWALFSYLKYGTYPLVMIATPLPQTKLYKICESNNYFTSNAGDESLSISTGLSGRGLIATDDFNPDSLKKIISKYYLMILFVKLCKLIIHPYEERNELKMIFLKPVENISRVVSKIINK